MDAKPHTQPVTAPQADRYERRAHAIIATMADPVEPPATDRRDGSRTRYLAQARLLLTEPGDGHEMTLYTRDLTGEGVGFIAHGELAPSTRVRVELPGPAGKTVEAEGQVVRTKAFASGWNEGYVEFISPIDLFSDRPIKAA